jgi:CRP-like cAMP-binding protein
MPPPGSAGSLLDKIAVRSHRVSKGAEILSIGWSGRQIVSIGEGIAIRYRLLPDGGRQIITFMFPGDACSTNIFTAHPVDHSVAAITDVRIDRINHDSMLDVVKVEPGVHQALWAMADEQSTILRDHITSLGRCGTRVRVAALLYELMERFDLSLGRPTPIAIPLTQSLLADAVGVTHIHFNRIIRDMIKCGIVSTRRGVLFVNNPALLEDIARPVLLRLREH